MKNTKKQPKLAHCHKKLIIVSDNKYYKNVKRAFENNRKT